MCGGLARRQAFFQCVCDACEEANLINFFAFRTAATAVSSLGQKTANVLPFDRRWEGCGENIFLVVFVCGWLRVGSLAATNGRKKK